MIIKPPPINIICNQNSYKRHTHTFSLKSFSWKRDIIRFFKKTPILLLPSASLLFILISYPIPGPPHASSPPPPPQQRKRMEIHFPLFPHLNHASRTPPSQKPRLHIPNEPMLHSTHPQPSSTKYSSRTQNAAFNPRNSMSILHPRNGKYKKRSHIPVSLFIHLYHHLHPSSPIPPLKEKSSKIAFTRRLQTSRTKKNQLLDLYPR